MKKLKQLVYLILLVAAAKGLTPSLNAMDEGKKPPRKDPAKNITASHAAYRKMKQFMKQTSAQTPNVNSVVSIEEALRSLETTKDHQSKENKETYLPNNASTEATDNTKVKTITPPAIEVETEDNQSEKGQSRIGKCFSAIKTCLVKEKKSATNNFNNSKILRALNAQNMVGSILTQLDSLTEEKKQKLDRNVLAEIKERLTFLNRLNHSTDYEAILKESNPINKYKEILANL